MRSFRALRTLGAAGVVALVAAGTSFAAEPASPAGVLSLSTSASTEVTKDLLQVVLSTQREGPDANAVQSALKQALDAALAEARKAAKPGQVDVQTGGFSLYPRYGSKGQATGWQGSAELIVEGRDVATIAQLTGRITALTIARVGYGLSRERREQVETDLTGQAITQFRSKAEQMAKQFGYAGAAIREVAVNGSEPVMPQMTLARGKAMASMAEEALPVEPGKATVSVTVSGSVQMK